MEFTRTRSGKPVCGSALVGYPLANITGFTQKRWRNPPCGGGHTRPPVFTSGYSRDRLPAHPPCKHQSQTKLPWGGRHQHSFSQGLSSLFFSVRRTVSVLTLSTTSLSASSLSARLAALRRPYAIKSGGDRSIHDFRTVARIPAWRDEGAELGVVRFTRMCRLISRHTGTNDLSFCGIIRLAAHDISLPSPFPFRLRLSNVSLYCRYVFSKAFFSMFLRVPL